MRMDPRGAVMLVNVVIVVACVWAAHAQTGPIVRTQHGKVVGVYEKVQVSFYDIPYGANPSGERRFKAPMVAPYKEEIYATNRNVTCAQMTPDGIKGTEDCLVLSVHTKSLSGKKPVLVWLESENYETTPSVRHSFENLVTEGLVVVSVNHRLSIFGFLCLRVPEAPANVGLLDIELALKWIRRNINNFGGDPSNVVLLGHGSGAALADIITLSPIADGLINKAIILSGSALAPWAVSYKNNENANAVGKKLGLPIASKQVLAHSLKTISVYDLLKAVNDLSKDNKMPFFAPCIDIDSSDNILPNDPINLLKSGTYNKIPYLTGYTNKEGTIKAEEIINGPWNEEIRKNPIEFLLPDITLDSKEKTKVMNEISNLYFTNEVIHLFSNNIKSIDEQQTITKDKEIDEVINYVGDVLQIVPIVRSVKERTKNTKSFQDTKANVFLFELQYQGTNNTKWPYPQRFLNGSKHGDILNHLLNYDLLYNGVISIKERFVKFVQTGLPEPDVERYTSWSPTTENHFSYFLLYGTANKFFASTDTTYPHEKKITFWNDIYSKYYRPLSSSASGLGCRVLILICYLFLYLH